jgi:hypothetical protein
MNWTSLRWTAILAAAFSYDNQPAHALQDQLHTFTFSQTGYAEGATVTGRFAGVDLDGNGILVHFPGQIAPPINTLELTEFSMQFSGNSLAPEFDLTVDDLFGFVYQLAWHQRNRRQPRNGPGLWRPEGRH